MQLTKLRVTAIIALLLSVSLGFAQTVSKELGRTTPDEALLMAEQVKNREDAKNFIAFQRAFAFVLVYENDVCNMPSTLNLTQRLRTKLTAARVVTTDEPEKHQNFILVDIRTTTTKYGPQVDFHCAVLRSLRLMDNPTTILAPILWEKRYSQVTDKPTYFIETTFDQCVTKLLMNIYAARNL
jgi:hypothetical protein